MTDNVNSPNHYAQSSINITTEPRDVMYFLCPEAMPIMAFKYLMRYKYKGNPKEDLEKALNYLQYYEDNRYVSCSDVKTFIKKYPLAETFIQCYLKNDFNDLIIKINELLDGGKQS